MDEQIESVWTEMSTDWNLPSDYRKCAASGLVDKRVSVLRSSWRTSCNAMNQCMSNGESVSFKDVKKIVRKQLKTEFGPTFSLLWMLYRVASFIYQVYHIYHRDIANGFRPGSSKCLEK